MGDYAVREYIQNLVRELRGEETDPRELQKERQLLQRMLQEAGGVGEVALSMGSSMVGEAAGGLAGAYDMAFGQGDARGARDAVQEALTYLPRTEAGQRNMRALGEGVQAAMDYKPVLRDQTIGEDLQAGAEFWEDSVVPWMQETFGDRTGSGVAAGVMGVLGAGVAPARATRPVGAVQKLSKQLSEGAITPGQYREKLLKGGYITQEEADLMPKGREAAIAETLTKNAGMNPEELAAAALAGWPKIGWYRNSANALQEIFGEDAPRFAYLLSALSPQTSVESNLKNAVHTWSNWVAAGRPTDKDAILDIMAKSVEGTGTEKSVLGAWRNNAYRALTAEDTSDIRFSGPKVSSFARNLVGQLGEVTNDAWMAKAMDVDQNIFSGAAKAGNADEFGPLGLQGAGYTAANAVTREAAQILSKKLRDHGVEVAPAEIQETVWSYAKAAYEARDGKGNTRTISELWDDGMITPEVIDSVPDFGTLLHATPEYHDALARAGAKVDNISPPTRTAFTPDVPLRQLAAFNERLEQHYRRAKAPEFLRRQNEQTIDTRPMVIDEGRLVSPKWMGGAKGRELVLDPRRRAQFESMGLAPPKIYALEPGDISGDLFNRLMGDMKSAHPFGAAVDNYAPEKYGDMRLLMTDQGGAGAAVDGGNITSVFRHPKSKDGGAGDFMLPLAIDQGGRRLDAFDTILPNLYSKHGFRPVSRVPFNPEYAPDGWDYERFGKFNEGQPDVMTMVLDPRGSEVLPVLKAPYDKRDPKQRRERDAMVEEDYGKAMGLLADEEEKIRQSGKYRRY